MAYRRSLDFLPGVFRTDINDKILYASMDQLISEPELQRLDGFIGRKFAPSYRPIDGYVSERSELRQTYQLEPASIYKDEQDAIKFVSTYQDLLDRLTSLGALTNDHGRLFAAKQYNYSGLFDYDKFVNFAKYYWLPDGPSSVAVFNVDIPIDLDITVTPPAIYQTIDGLYEEEGLDTSGFSVSSNPVRRVRNDGYKFSNKGQETNPRLRLVRGGSYRFRLDQLGHGFNIQTRPGLTLNEPYQNNLYVRDVYGVTNNGEDVGVITFNVPEKDAQDFFIDMPRSGTVNFVAYSNRKKRFLRYTDVQYQSYQDLYSIHGGLDGGRFIEGKEVLFLPDPATDSVPQPWAAFTFYEEGDLVNYANTVYRVLSTYTTGRTFSTTNLEVYDKLDTWYDPSPFDSNELSFDSGNFDRGNDVSPSNRHGKFSITITSDGLIKLSPSGLITQNTKVEVLEGIAYGNRHVYKADDGLRLVSNITANLDFLYYQDSLDTSAYGVIELVDTANDGALTVEASIIGLPAYTSPNGVKFTNGLKVKFLGEVKPESYYNKDYYVEGVGNSIRLVEAASLVNPETYLDETFIGFDSVAFDISKLDEVDKSPLTKDYILINRADAAISSWSRSNRWFHEDVLSQTSSYNNQPTNLDFRARAKRPIIEFEPDLQLHDFGKQALTPVTLIDTVTIDALSDVEGKAVTINDSGLSSYQVDGVQLVPGMTVIFAADQDRDVKDKVWSVSYIRPQSETDRRTASYIGDGVTASFYLGFEVSDAITLQVLIDGVPSYDAGYSWSLTSTDTVEFNTSSPYTAPASGVNISFILDYDQQIHLTMRDADISVGDTVTITEGLVNKGKQLYYDGTNWIAGQNKTKVNQAPLFSLVDKDGVPFNDDTKYPISTFAGNKIFAYQESDTGKTDTELGFRLKYRNINNVGDILFKDYVTSSSFSYRDGTETITLPTAGARLIRNKTDGSIELVNQWVEKQDTTRPYQLQTYFASIYQKNLFPLNVLPDDLDTALEPTNLLVYINNAPVNNDKFDIQIEGKLYYLLLDDDLATGDKLDIKIRSRSVNDDSVFELAKNLDLNPLNQEISDFTLGQIRNHIVSSFDAAPGFVGDYLGANNSRDIANIKKYGGLIVQNLGASHLANLFLNDKQANFIDSISFAQREHARFKNKMLELAYNLPLTDPLDPVLSFEEIMEELVSNKSVLFPFHYSDMVGFTKDYKKLTYVVDNTQIINYDLTEIFDPSMPSGKSVLVYINNRQLLKDIEYRFLADQPIVQLILSDNDQFFNFSTLILAQGDVIEIREYNNTDGSYIPPTPTKLGLYPAFVPAQITDGYEGNYRQVIRGHDGSLTALFNDHRDGILLEYEHRVYNNLKVTYDGKLSDVKSFIPGAFRSTEYNKQEFEQILSTHFNSWLGKSGLGASDLSNFDGNDPFSWNYSRTTSKVDGRPMPAAYWRGIYKYYFDCDEPHLRPWEMLGFSVEPSWWRYYYGPAPYTRGNKVLWDDIAAGKIVDGERAGTDARFARPGLVNYIPVDESGEMLSPLSCLVKDYNSLDVSGPYKFGDGGPVETAWAQSSEYPFVLQIAMALMHPAEYFGANLDKNRQVLQSFGSSNNQWIYSTNGLRRDINARIHGENNDDGTVHRSNGYVTYISDYAVSLGLNRTTAVGDKLRDLRTQLAYKAGGFTDKKYLKVYADQASPNANNTSVMVPDEDYSIVINKSAPTERISYSGVIVTKTADGYSVLGYDDNSPYFTIETSSTSGRKDYIKVGNASATKYLDGTGLLLQVPYGTEFYNAEQVVDFLISYGRYLTSRGFVFTDKLDEDAGFYKDWDLAAREFLFYVQQGWEQDVAISISPVGDKINFRADLGVVDGLTNSMSGSRVITEDFRILRPENYQVTRHGREFSLQTNDNSGIYLLDIDVVTYEHVLVFENITRFSDLIYDPSIGARQFRLKVKGFRTGDWDGSFGAAGFIINDDNIQEWQQHKNYYKGEIVLFKKRYWVASSNVPGAPEFDNKVWIESDYDQVKKGLLPNLANRAGLFKSFYDIDSVNLEQDTDRLGKGLIGLRPRSYFENLQISDTSQAKFYQGMITQKGSRSSFNKLLRAKLDNFDGTVDFFEEWALRTGQYGAGGSRELLQLNINEATASRDPLVIELLSDNDDSTPGRLSYYKNDIWLKAQPFNNNWLNTRSHRNMPNDLPNSGYALLDDVDYTSSTVGSLNTSIDATLVGEGDRIWIAADITNQWNIHRVEETGIRFKKVTIAKSGLATVEFDGTHGLNKDDLFLLKTVNNRPALSGFYRVTGVTSNKALTFNTSFQQLNETSINGQLYKLPSLKFDYSTDLVGREPAGGWIVDDKFFLNNSELGGWAVYENKEAFKQSIKYYPQDEEIVIPTPDATVNGQYGFSLGTDKNNNYLLVGQPGSQQVFTYRFVEGGSGLEQATVLAASALGLDGYGKVLAVSSNGWTAIAAPDSDSDIGYVTIVRPSDINDKFGAVQIIPPYSLDVGGKFGSALAISDDGFWLAIGQPDIDGGYVYVYQLREKTIPPDYSQYFVADASSLSFVLTGLAADPEDIDSIRVLVNGSELVPTVDYTLSGSTVTLVTLPPYAAIIEVIVSRGLPEQTFNGDGSTSTFTLTGDSTGINSPYQVKVVVDGQLSIPFRDFTISGDSIVFTSVPALYSEINVRQTSYYELVTAFTADDNENGDRFGASLDFSQDGRRLLVGAPNASYLTEDSTLLSDVGAVYVYDRTAIAHTSDGSTVTFYADVYDDSAAAEIYNASLPSVYVDGTGVKLANAYDDGDYQVNASGDITFNQIPRIGASILIENNHLYLTAKLLPNDFQAGGNFGYSAKICPTVCSVYVGAPFKDGSDEKIDAGCVYRFVNQGRFYGSITGTVDMPSITNNSTLILNDYWINLYAGDNLDDVINAINDADVPGVSARDADGKLKIETNSLVALDKLKITTDDYTVVTDLGLEIYYQQQIIRSPSNQEYGLFGKAIAVMPTAELADTIAIAGENITSNINTTFDSSRTSFDRKSTTFTNVARNSGAVITYQYIARPDDSLLTPGVFIPAQRLTNGDLHEGDKFGASVAMSADRIYTGAPSDDTYATDGGVVFSFALGEYSKAWQVARRETDKVDIELINRISFIDTQFNRIIADIDFIDPYKGKISSVASQELGYITSYDPAVYTNGAPGKVRSNALPWGAEKVGELWWDTSQVRWLDYESGDIDNRAANWNTAFPNSAILVYEWTQSDLPPAQYSDEVNRESFVRDNNSYAVKELVDAQGNITLRYYFWVGGKTSSPNVSGRALSAVQVENIIANPKAAGIPFAAFIAPNAIALYNCKQFLRNNYAVLSIDYDSHANDDNLHAEYQLLAEGDETSYVDADVWIKIIDSLAGTDADGRLVPDPYLTPGRKYGKHFRPRQTMFLDRISALRVAVDYINNAVKKNTMLLDKDTTALLSKEPIPRAVSSNYNESVASKAELDYLVKVRLSLGHKVLVTADESVNDRWTIYRLSTQDGDITRYWELVHVQEWDNTRFINQIDWLDPNEPQDIDITDYVVDFNYQLIELSPGDKQTVKIKDDGRGLYSIVRYDATGAYKIIKRQAATFQIDASIYDQALSSFGFDNEVFDLQIFDDWSSIEVQKILHAVYDDIFTLNQNIEKNRLFFIIIQYLLNEQKYVDWIFKSSFIKVQQRQTAIRQIPVYQIDNQDMVRSYISENKPYHTKIREFVLRYDGSEIADNDITDFDVPAYYISETGRYRSPNGSETIDDFILDLYPYTAWRDNHKFVVSSIDVVDGGVDYIVPPPITITGGGGTGARAEATVINGSITKVTVLDSGFGYTSTPNVSLGNTGGTGASLVARITNDKIRKVSSTLKFDRLPAQTSSFLVEFKNGSGEAIDVRSERISRLQSQAGVVDHLIDLLTPDAGTGLLYGGWLVNTAADIGYPIGAPVYKIFDDASGRVQIFYRHVPGGEDHLSLEEALQDLGTNVGVNGLDITGTTVVVDGTFVDYNTSIIDWKADTVFRANDAVYYKGNTYRVLNTFTTDAYFSTDDLATLISEDYTNDLDEYSMNLPFALEWQPETQYFQDDYILDADTEVMYKVTKDFISGQSFSISSLVKMTGDDFDNHIDRIWAYYQPTQGQLGKDLTQLLAGIDYPGIKVKGASFSQEPGFDAGLYDLSGYDAFIIGPEGVAVLDPALLDTSLTSSFDDIALGTRPEDIITFGGDFVDRYSSHAPEEMVPGRVYDTVDIKVYSSPSDTWVQDNDLGMNIVLTSAAAGDDVIFSYVQPVSRADAIIVLTKNFGRLIEGLDYTADRADNTVSITRSMLPTDEVYIYALDTGGEGLLFDGEFTTDGQQLQWEIPIDRNQITQVTVTLDGQKVTNYELLPTTYTTGVSTIYSTIRFDSPPAADQYLGIYVFRTASSNQALVEVNNTSVTAAGGVYPDDYTISLDRSIGYDYPRLDKLIIEVAGSRLNPPNSIYHIADGSSIYYSMPDSTYIDPDDVFSNVIKVAVNGVNKNHYEHWILGPSDGSTILNIEFIDPPAAGDDVVITYTGDASYQLLDDSTVLIDAGINIEAGTKINVLTFKNHDTIGMRTQVFKGSSTATATVATGYDETGFDTIALDATTTTISTVTQYTLSRPVNNISYLWVTVDVEGDGAGQQLYPNRDYKMLSPTVLEINPTLGITPSSFVIVTSFAEVTQKPSIGFRIFKDLNDNFEYYRISRYNLARTVSVLNINDAEIYLDDVSGLATPNPDMGIPGAIMVGGEIIHYYIKDTVNNKLGQLRRGVKGTAAIQTIAKGTRVQDVSRDQAIPSAHDRIWYDAGTGTPSNGLGLQYSTTEQALFLLAKPTLLESRVYDDNYMVSGYIEPGYVEGNVYE